jgi:hypothetical protein
LNRLIRGAIRERQLIEFWLHGLRRVAEPHVYGVHKGIFQLLVYQTAGESRSGRLPAWRRVDLSEVSGLRVLDERFLGSRLPPSRHKDWDQILEVVG